MTQERAAVDAGAGAAPGYGPLVPDPRGRLALPERFRYRILSRSGDATRDHGYNFEVSNRWMASPRRCP